MPKKDKKKRRLSSDQSNSSVIEEKNTSRSDINEQIESKEKQNSQSTFNTAILSNMSNMETSIDTSDVLSVIEDNMDAIAEKIQQSLMWKKMESDMESMDYTINSLKKENESLKARLELAEGRATRAEKKIEDLKEKVIYLTTRSMRDNLIFKNIPEEEHESEDAIKAKIMDICTSKLKMSPGELTEVQIERTHRFGKRIRGNNRNIVAKLNSKGKARILSKLKNLSKQDSIRISEQFPPEITARRNKLWPSFINAKQQGKEAKFNGDKLIIENRVHTAPKDAVSDINVNVTSRSLSMKPKHTDVASMDQSHFQGHLIPVKSRDDIIPAIQALCKDPRIAGASHLLYAYRIGNETFSISNYEDDGESGAGRVIIEAVDNHRCYNHLIAVSVWYGSKFLGPARYDQIRKQADEALNKIT